MMKKYAIAIAISSVIFTGCSKLSPEAREITGKYFIPEISEDVAIMELNDDGTCIIRAIKPQVLTYEVPGTWDVLKDSLVMDLIPERLSFEGDSTLIGNIARTIHRHIKAHSEITLTLENEGIEYIYQRKNNKE